MQIELADHEAVHALRTEVFVNEQGVSPEIEVDAGDKTAIHVAAREGDEVIGCARILLRDGEAYIGRLAVRRTCRGRGVGARIMRYATEYAGRAGCRKVALHAQLHARAFYEKLGFSAVGDEFFEAGIAHIGMEMILSSDIG